MNRGRRITKIVLVLLVGILLFWAVNTASRGFRESGSANALFGLQGAMSAVAALQPVISLNLVDITAGVVAVVIVLLISLYRRFSKPERVGEEHGSARWGRPSDIKPFMNRDPKRNLWLAKDIGLNLERAAKPEHQRNLNVTVLGASGSGKSRFFVVPNLIRGLSSGLVVDPKGELLKMTGTALAEAGYRIRVLNLIDFASSDGFNPLQYLRPGHEPEDVALLVRNIITNTSVEGRQTGGDPFWERAESALLTALISYVAAACPIGERHMGTVIDLLGKMQAAEAGSVNEIDDIFAAVAMGGAGGNELLQFAASQYGIYTQAATETAASIIVTAGVRLAPLYIPAVRRLLTVDTLKLDTVGFEPTMLFLIISDADKQFSWLASTVFTTFFQRSIYLADRQPDRQLPIPVMCWMDEFANIGKIPDFEVLAATIRSRRISFAAVVQDIGQGKRVYKEGWNSIIGNCDTVLFLGSADAETKKWVSEHLGKQTIRTIDTSTSHGRNASSSQQRKTIGRELLSADEIGRIPGNQALVLIRGLPPFRAQKLPPVPEGRPYVHANNMP